MSNRIRIYTKVTPEELAREGEVTMEQITEAVRATGKAIEDIELQAPVKIGDVVLANVCDTGVDVIATKNVGVKA